jgi:hypothetical protein
MTRLRTTHHASRSIKSAFRADKSAAGWLRAATADPNLFIIIAFCAVGLLVTLNLMLRFPDVVASFAQIGQFLG